MERWSKRTCRWNFVLLTAIFTCILYGKGPDGYAQPLLKLLLDPPLQENTIYLEDEKTQPILIQPQVQGKWKQVIWKFSGPGTFTYTEIGGMYTPPSQLKEASATAIFTVIVFDHKGKSVTEKLLLTVRKFPPTPSPSPSPTFTPTLKPSPTPSSTPTPKSTSTPIPTVNPTFTPALELPLTSTLSPKHTIAPKPSPESTITPTATPTASATSLPTPTPTMLPSTPTPEALPTSIPSPTPTRSPLKNHLKDGEEYLRKKWYTTPDGENAFNEFKAALQIEPENARAKQGVYKILRQYKYWADDEYRKENHGDAKKAYDRYLMVADYLIVAFDDEELRQEVQEVREHLEQLP